MQGYRNNNSSPIGQSEPSYTHHKQIKDGYIIIEAQNDEKTPGSTHKRNPAILSAA